MKHVLLALALLCVAPVAHAAEATAADTEESCKAKWEVRTGSDDSRNFFIRRCISNVRKTRILEKQIERQQAREAARFSRSAAQISERRRKSERFIDQAIKRQILKYQRFRAPTHTLDKTPFIQARWSRRAITRNKEGLDRINAIRRQYRAKNYPDPCTQVRAYGKKNNPCKPSQIGN